MWLALCFFLAIAGFFLWQEHRAHLLGALPYVLLLLCPVIHLFMHRGHSGRGHGVHGGTGGPWGGDGRRP
jgi:drug/metabolite transporter superfamily protein YnfA